MIKSFLVLFLFASCVLINYTVDNSYKTVYNINTELKFKIYNWSSEKWIVDDIRYTILKDGLVIYTNTFDISIDPDTTKLLSLPAVVRSNDLSTEYLLILTSESGDEFYSTAIVR
jgi:hypothetical protein